MKRALTAGFLVLLAVVLFVSPLFASEVVSFNARDLLTSADVAFTGKCLKAEPSVRMGMLVTTYTFQVAPDGVLKGNVPETFQFIQAGGTKTAVQQLQKQAFTQFPVYTPGNEYTLFLTGESGIGLRAPVGLSQGKFMVTTAPDGTKQVVNGLGNKALFQNLPATPAMSKAMSVGGVSEGAPAGPMNLDRFMQMMKQMRDANP